jgi:spiro-SPASM protein
MSLNASLYRTTSFLSLCDNFTPGCDSLTLIYFPFFSRYFYNDSSRKYYYSRSRGCIVNTEYTAAAVLFAGGLRVEAFERCFDGKSAFTLALKKAAGFPAVVKIVILIPEDFDETLVPAGVERIELVREAKWNTDNFLQALARAGEGFNLTYFAWADCPFLDIGLAGSLAARHLRGAADYSYADGWPDGLAPEILSPGTAAILAKINTGRETPVERDTIFAVLRRDINAFDIETEISPVDLRQLRLNLAASGKRGLLLLRRFWEAGLAAAESTSRAVEKTVTEKPDMLRTLPSFYPVQISAPCPQRCTFCPYPKSAGFVYAESDTDGPENDILYMKPENFSRLLDKIIDFSGDAVIDISLWGETGLHPRRLELVGAVLRRPALSLIIETSGLGWKRADFERLAGEAAGAAPRKNGMAALSWIVSLDSAEEAGYRKLRGDGFASAVESARSIVSLFPRDGYVQAVRMKGNEEDIEKFYRSWKEEGANVIIQKYDSFCGILPALSAADLSPVKRNPCWHLARDMPVLLDGSVPVCRSSGELLGNAFSENLEEIWRKGEARYLGHCEANYGQPCAKCDEYYTFNF